MNPLAVATLQVLLLVVALAAAGVAALRGLRLARRAAREGGGARGWEHPEVQAGLRHAVAPLWWTAAAVVLTALVPRFAGMGAA